MNTVVILCGANSCGKTTTLKGFFGVGKDVDSPKGYIEKQVNGKIVCAVSFSSPQEQVKVFCKFEKVQENVKNRLKICDEKASSKPYFCLIPFTISGSRREKKNVNKNCILKPIKELRKNYHVFVIYLRKSNTHHLKDKDALIAEIAAIEEGFVVRPFIETTREDRDNCDKSNDLKKRLEEKILK